MMLGDFIKQNRNEINRIKKESMNEFLQQSPEWQKKARKYLDDPTEAKKLLNEAVHKASRNMSGPLQEVWDALQVLFSLIKDWIAGEYRVIPTRSILLILASLVYFVSPIDIIPEFIAGLGLIDDAMVIAWIVNQLKRDLDDYRIWKNTQDASVVDVTFSEVVHGENE